MKTNEEMRRGPAGDDDLVQLAVLGVVALGAVAIGFSSCSQRGETYGLSPVAAPAVLPTAIVIEASKDQYCLVCLVRATPAPMK